ncbi:MAG TPA: hypothetical protein VFH38_08480 [Jatrophihabitans sp.]|nr:hypothetical protein [Jatrophihabitans sp.]
MAVVLTALATLFIASIAVPADAAPGSPPSGAVTGTQPSIPPQRTPAPVARSHYLRMLNGHPAHDYPVMRRMGAVDAARNRPNHRYLVLQDIGAQARGGVVLSATVRYVTYGELVGALEAYLAGYVSHQRPAAPAIIAVGTNNDGIVSRAEGIVWARRVVRPLAVWCQQHAPDVQIAGANDMEPGFRGSVRATEAWLAGFLAGGTADFVFNGSADGCPTNLRHVRCNNRWTTHALHWLAGGADRSRIMALPQIYNTTMPWQWKAISAVHQARLDVVGPLTEHQACQQARSCFSVVNPRAWRMLFHALRSSRITAVPQLPYGPDLRIN